METQWAVSRVPEPRQDSRRSTSAISDSSSRWPRQTVAWTASTAATRCASEWKSFLPTLPPTDPGEERKTAYRTYVRLSSPSVCLSQGTDRMALHVRLRGLTVGSIHHEATPKVALDAQ